MVTGDAGDDVVGAESDSLAIADGGTGNDIVTVDPYLANSRATATILDDDLPRYKEPQLPSGTAIILFADIADSTALTEHLGDAAFRAKARDLDGALREVIREHAGTAIEGKLLGDGVLAVFTSARQAIEAALACGKAGAMPGCPCIWGFTRETSSARRTTCTAVP